MLNKHTRSGSVSLHWLGALALLLAGAAFAQDYDPPGRVARVNSIEGQASVQLAGDSDWTTDVLNRPLTTGDKLWVDSSSRAEMHAGSIAYRLGAQTGVEWLDLGDQVSQLRFTAGSLNIRVRDLQRDESVEVATPNVSVSLLEPGEYRLDVDENGDMTHVAVISGQAEVTGANDSWRVHPRESAQFQGSHEVSADVGDLEGPDALDLWAEQRDAREDRAESARYVSRDVPGYSDLDDYGSWDSDPEYGPLWTPRVVMGWAPYHYGHWVWVSPWGWTWMDDAPWGFAPFHYGRWVHRRDRWCWSPGRLGPRPVYAPALVAWVGGSHFTVGVSVGGGGVGWFPLGYNEVYRPAYRVSNTYIRNVNVTNTYINNTTIINNTTVINGRGGRGPRGDREQHYVNQRVPGAVAAVPHDAFVSARQVDRHLLPLDQRAVAIAAASTAAVAIAPTLRSHAREPGPQLRVARPTPAVFSRPIVSQRVPAPMAPSFAAQREAVVANGDRPVPLQQISRSRNYPMVPVRIVRPAEAPRSIEATRAAPGLRREQDRPGGSPVTAPSASPSRAGPDRPGQPVERRGEERPAVIHRDAPADRPSATGGSASPPPRNDRPPSAVRPFDRYAQPAPAERGPPAQQDRADRPAPDDARVRAQQEQMRQRAEQSQRADQQRVDQQRQTQEREVQQQQRVDQQRQMQEREVQQQRAEQQRQVQERAMQQQAEQQRQMQQRDVQQREMQQREMQQREIQRREAPPARVEPPHRVEAPRPQAAPSAPQPAPRRERDDGRRDR